MAINKYQVKAIVTHCSNFALLQNLYNLISIVQCKFFVKLGLKINFKNKLSPFTNINYFMLSFT